MSGLIRLLISGAAGAWLAVAMPRAAFLAATQELIGFLSLLMAGLLPAMILTATILKGGGFSAKRVEDYGRALRVQLRFWAVLFFFAAASTFGVVMAKAFSAATVSVHFQIGHLPIDQSGIVAAAIGVAGAGVGIVLQRLFPAYRGLLSLLELNVSMAKAEAIAHDRTMLDALSAQAGRATSPPEYGSQQTGPTHA